LLFDLFFRVTGALLLGLLFATLFGFVPCFNENCPIDVPLEADERRAIPLLEDFALQELLSRALSLDAGVGT